MLFSENNNVSIHNILKVAVAAHLFLNIKAPLITCFQVPEKLLGNMHLKFTRQIYVSKPCHCKQVLPLGNERQHVSNHWKHVVTKAWKHALETLCKHLISNLFTSVSNSCKHFILPSVRSWVRQDHGKRC